MRVYRPGIDELVRAASIINDGGLVAFPTETVYGLGALGLSEESVLKIFSVKGRSLEVPLILHVSSMEMFEESVSEVPEIAYKLIKSFWPGPLTLVLPKSIKVPKAVTAGKETVGVRWPSHPLAQELIKLVNEPLAAPSANKFMSLPPLTAGDVVEELNGSIDAVIDAGEVPLGIESTVLDLTANPFKVLRPGSVPIDVLENFLGESVVRAFKNSLRKYKLSVEVFYIRSCRLKELVNVVDSVIKVAGSMSSRNLMILGSDESVKDYLSKGLNSVSLGSRRKPLEIGKGFVKVLRSLRGWVGKIIIEPFPCRGVWEAVDYRFMKAASEVLSV